MSSIFKALTFGKTKHEKLPEEWGEDIKEPVSEGLPFHCKYIGSTLVEKASDDTTTADAIKTIIQMSKMSGKAKSLRKVVLTIKPTGISCKDALNDDEIFDISIYRISYCPADVNYDRVVAFIATNKNGTHECHAFLTRKDEVARACALKMSQAFSNEFEKYKEAIHLLYVKSRKANWVQLSGHENTFAFGGPDILYKKCKPNSKEVIAYNSLLEEVTMRPFIPMYHGTKTIDGKCHIAIDNLLYPFDNPSIMDIKMGSRTFLEDEVSNDEPRIDLYEKMVNLDPDSLSEEEKVTRAITKLKYMQLREQLSSSSDLGFRIEAFKTDSKQTAAKDLSFVKTRDQVKNCLQQFLPNRRDQLNALLDRLLSLQNSFKNSSFFSTHEVIGSSLLIVYDKSKVDVWMIDFAKTVPLPQGVTIDHVSPWVYGNHEDGYLTGLHNLINIVQEFCKKN